MSLIIEIFVFMIAFWLASEFVDGIRIKGIRALLLASVTYLIALVIGRIVITILLSIFTLGLLPFIWLISYALAAYIAFAIVVGMLNSAEATSAGMLWGIIVVTISSWVIKLFIY